MNKRNIWMHLGIATLIVGIAAVAGQIRNWQVDSGRYKVVPKVRVSKLKPVVIKRSLSNSEPEILVKFKPNVKLADIKRLAAKNNDRIEDEIERKILSMYGRGMSYSDIREHVEDMYGISVSSAAISAITDKIIDRVKEWRERPLETHYPFVWLDAIHYKVRADGHYQSRAIYTVLGLGIEGKKEVLGLYLSESEGANFWLGVLSDLQNRGVEDILIASVDGLTGFPEAIQTIFPNTEVQLCIVHQIRNSLRYVGSKHQKAFMVDLKRVYRSKSLGEAELALDDLESLSGEKHPIVIKSGAASGSIFPLTSYILSTSAGLFAPPTQLRRCIVSLIN